MKNIEKKSPVLLLDGIQSALSLTRSLGRRGIKIYHSCADNAIVKYSKYCTKSFPYPNKEKVHEFWTDLLLNQNNFIPQGSVIFPCNDDAVEFVAKNRDALAANYILDESVPEIHLTMLNKKKTSQLAKSLNISIPNFWEIEKSEELEQIASQVVFPVIIKPHNSLLFQKHFGGKKYFFANNLEDLNSHLKKVFDKNIKFMICEFIPGPDTLSGSYATYMDANGNCLFHFTKKIIRRYPINEGVASYYKTDWDEQIAELGLKFFQGIEFRGLGMIEFKKDLRDGHLKMIECNPRFTAHQELLVRSGIDISEIIYNHLVGLPVPKIDKYKEDVRLWYPIRDFGAYKQLRRRKDITFWGWIKSILHKPVFPYFKWKDPLPSIMLYFVSLKKFLKVKIDSLIN